MSFNVMSWASKQSTGSSSNKLVLLMLADRSNDEGECYPSIQRIADDCEMSVRTVRYTIKKLASAGFLCVNPRARKGQQTSNLYKLNIGGAESASPDEGGVQNLQGGGAENDPPRGAESASKPVKEPVKETYMLNASPSTNAEEGGRADSQKCDYQKREPTERGYNAKLAHTFRENETDAQLALKISKWIMGELQKLTTKPLNASVTAEPIIKLFKIGATPRDIKDTVDFITGPNQQNECKFVLESPATLPKKWNNLQSAMERTKPEKKVDGPKMLTMDDINEQIERTG